MRRLVVFLLAMMLGGVSTLVGSSGPVAAASRTYTLGVVKDGPSNQESILDLIIPELDHLLGSNSTIQLKQAPEFDAGWDGDRARQVIVSALDDPEVDLIVGIGSLVTQAAAGDDLPLSKPFVSAVVTLGDLEHMPYSMEDSSLKPNFAFVVISRGMEEAIRVFQEMAELSSVHVGIDQEVLEHLDGAQEALAAIGETLSIRLVPVPVTSDGAGVVAGLDADAEAFLLTPMPRLTGGARQDLVDGLNERDIRTFSTEGEPDLNRGVLATNLVDLPQQVSRRVAINIQQLLLGTDVAELPVFLLPQTRLHVNGRTARTIGFQPNYEVRLAADLLYSESLLEHYPTLSLDQVFRLAEEGNVTLAITDAQVESELRDKQVARAGLYPQLLADGSYMSHDYQGLESLFPNQMGTVGLVLEQMIYNDQTISDFRSAGRLYEASEFRRDAARLEVLVRGGREYLNFVLARLFYGIELENLRLTEANLEIARTRVHVGHAGQDEVFRWEAAVANSQGNLVTSAALVEKNRVALNQTLGLSQERNWRPLEIEVEPGSIPLFDGKLDFILDSPSAYNVFREAMVEYALSHAPEVAYFTKNLEAQEIQVGQRQRSFYLPRVSASVQRDWNYYTSERGLKREGSIFLLGAKLPLFEGTGRLYDVKRQRAKQRGIEHKLDRTLQLVEKRTRTVLYKLESSYPDLVFSRTAAEKARRNFEVIREKYAAGITTITRMLEAQNSAYQAKLSATAADYVLLKDLIDLQRAVAFFGANHSAEERESFIAEIYTLMGELGYPPPENVQ